MKSTIRSSVSQMTKPKEKLDTNLEIRIPVEVKKLAQYAAGLKGITLSAFVRETLAAHADEVLRAEEARTDKVE